MKELDAPKKENDDEDDCHSHDNIVEQENCDGGNHVEFELTSDDEVDVLEINGYAKNAEVFDGIERAIE